MKNLNLKLLVVIVGLFASALATAQGIQNICENTTLDRGVCLHMRTLRAQLHAIDAQRELMQVNPPYMNALASGVAKTAHETIELMGTGIPEHRIGLVRLETMAEDLAAKAAKNDSQMMYVANRLRGNCASCHASGNPAGGHNWDDVFQYDWFDISSDCSSGNKNPYLCKSMHGLLSANSYHRAAFDAGIQDYVLTRAAAIEITRILEDLKAKNFRHLPEDKRVSAIVSAQEVADLAEKQDPTVFAKANAIVQACTSCHTQVKKFSDFQKPNWFRKI